MSDIITTFTELHDFPLDDFQAEAIHHIDAGKSVVVCAPTGAGKTIIAEFAALKALNDGVKLFYTTPLKALSNQKYNDLKERYGEQNVGLLTGDATVNRDARMIVMTTEVFRNMLYGLNEDSGLVKNLGYVVLDECHFMNDADRGTVWEESIIYCPPTVQMVALSATVANAKELTRWINRIHPDCELVSSSFRPVPLQFHYYHRYRLHPLFEQDGKTLNGKLVREGSRQAKPIKGKRRAPIFSPSDLIASLSDRNMLPAIVFTFSRKGCENHLRACLDMPLVSLAEKELITRFVDEFCEKNSLSLQPYTRQALLNGVGSHHAGLLPGVKMLVEQLFQRGLMKAVFATETLAAGINMPARTTVITAISKRVDVGHRMLTASEFLQMSGRAGRRGMDTEGHVVVVSSPFEGAPESAKLASAPADPLNSQFTPTYGMVLNLLQKLSLDEAGYLVSKSFGAFTSERRTKPLTEELEERRLVLDEAVNFPCPHELSLEDFQTHLKERQLLSQTNKQSGIMKKQLRKYGETPELLEENERLQAEKVRLIEAVETHVCSACDVFKKHRRLEEKVHRLNRQVNRLESRVDEEKNVYWNQFLQIHGLLKDIGHINDQDKPTSDGILTSKLRTENELFVSEALATGAFNDLTPEALAAVTSAIVNDSNRDNAMTQFRYSKEVRTTLNRLYKVADKVDRLQRQHGVDVQLNINPAMSALVEAWSRGMSWSALTSATTLDAGDLVRNFRRTSDLLRQLSKIPDIPQAVSYTAYLAFVSMQRPPVKDIEINDEWEPPKLDE